MNSRELSKPELIVVDEDEQPPEKRARDDGESIVVSPSLPSADLIDQQQKVLKLEDMYKRACRTAREAELRAERAENLLDSKREVLEDSRKDLDEELEKRLAEFASQLAEARTNANDLTCANDALKIELFKTRRREEKANGMIDDLARENSALRTELDAARRIVADADVIKCDLLRQNAALERGVGDAWRKAESIREEEERKRRQLQQELQQIRFEQQQPLMSAGPSSVAGAQQWMQVAPQPLPYSQPADPFAGPQLVQRVRKLAETAHPTNILEPCNPFAIDSIPFASAIAQIEAKFYECRIRGPPSVSKKLANHFKKSVRQSMNLFCPLCNIRRDNQSILFHFMGQQHTDKARAHNSAVSEPALCYWLRQMQQAADSAAAEASVVAAVVGAATAAPAAAPSEGATM